MFFLIMPHPPPPPPHPPQCWHSPRARAASARSSPQPAAYHTIKGLQGRCPFNTAGHVKAQEWGRGADRAAPTFGFRRPWAAIWGSPSTHTAMSVECATRFCIYIGNQNYSSWSMRPWLMLSKAGARCEFDFDVVKVVCVPSQLYMVAMLPCPGCASNPGRCPPPPNPCTTPGVCHRHGGHGRGSSCRVLSLRLGTLPARPGSEGPSHQHRSAGVPERWPPLPCSAVFVRSKAASACMILRCGRANRARGYASVKLARHFARGAALAAGMGCSDVAA